VDGPSIATRALLQLARLDQVDGGVPAQAAERYRLDDITAGTSGTAGGDV
jgi:pyruvate dehydrogenase E1 component